MTINPVSLLHFKRLEQLHPAPLTPPEEYFWFQIFESYQHLPSSENQLSRSHESGSAYCTDSDLTYVVRKWPLRRKSICTLLEAKTIVIKNKFFCKNKIDIWSKRPTDNWNLESGHGLSSAHLSRGTANQYSGCFLLLPNCWTMAVVWLAKDFLIGFPTLIHRNIGGVLLFSSFEGSISESHIKTHCSIPRIVATVKFVNLQRGLATGRNLIQQYPIRSNEPSDFLWYKRTTFLHVSSWCVLYSLLHTKSEYKNENRNK